MNALVEKTPVPSLNLDRSLKTLSLPEWLQRSVSGLTVGWESAVRPDGIEGRRNTPVIARSLAPSKEARMQIEARIRELRAARAAVDIDMAMTAVTELLLSFSSQAMNEAGAKARARGYIVALEDLPAWAIAEACRLWLRGEAGEANYNFAPAPPVLRKIANTIASRVDHQRSVLERLLNAKIVEDEPQFDDRHCETMRAQLAALWRSFGTPKHGAAALVPALPAERTGVPA